jgi:4-hydroxybenzoate polyprenyltransferase
VKALRQWLYFLLYSNFFIAGVAVLMAVEALLLAGSLDSTTPYLPFLFFSTLCSYSFHYYFTESSGPQTIRTKWLKQHKKLLGILFLGGLTGLIISSFQLKEELIWIGPAAVATFLYSAPQLPHPQFRKLRKIAYGKTIFLALIWTYASTVLPVICSQHQWTPALSVFTAARYFFVYCICILFDLRDREQDRAIGVKSLVTYLSDRNTGRLFWFSWLLSMVFTGWLSQTEVSFQNILFQLTSLILLASLYRPARKQASDLLYYVVLDGLMALSAVLTLFARI